MKRYKQSSLPRFLYDHSLTFVSLMVLGLWIVLYFEADPKTHTGAFFGNAIADWSGTVLIVFATTRWPVSGQSFPYDIYRFNRDGLDHIVSSS
jgi:hypothetical protein